MCIRTGRVTNAAVEYAFWLLLASFTCTAAKCYQHMLQDNPEGHVRSMDVETGPDADTPRPCGLALLLCMIERSRTTAETALVGFASRLQVSGACALFRL